MENQNVEFKKESRLTQVEVGNHLEKARCLSDCPPDVITLMLSQDCLSAYDAYSLSLVSHYFREIFFSYALKPNHEKNLLNNPKYSQSPSSLGLIFVNLLGQATKLSAKEKYEQFPVECLKDKFWPFNPISSKELARLNLDSSIMKDAFATGKCEIAEAHETYSAMVELKENTGRAFLEIGPCLAHYIIAGLIKDMDEANTLVATKLSPVFCLTHPEVQRAIVGKKVTVQEVLNYDEQTVNAIFSYKKYHEQLTFEQAVQYPAQAIFFAENKCIRDMISKEELNNWERGVKMKNEFLTLKPNSLEMLLLSLNYFAGNENPSSFSPPHKFRAELNEHIEQIDKILVGIRDKDNHAHTSDQSKGIWAKTLQPIVELIAIDKSIKVNHLLKIPLENLLLILEEPIYLAFKSGKLNVEHLMQGGVNSIRSLIKPDTESCTIQ